MNANGVPGGHDFLPRWLRLARSGSVDALGKLLDMCRQYLLSVANQELRVKVRGKLAPSDLVQDTFLEAQRDFPGFRGESEADLMAWLRSILLHNVANAHRSFCQTDKRQVAREVALPTIVDRNPQVEPAAPDATPSAVVAAREQIGALRLALEQLPEHYRQVVIWRNFDLLEFEVIGQRLGRSPEAARKLWGRAIEQLQQLLDPSTTSEAR